METEDVRRVLAIAGPLLSVVAMIVLIHGVARSGPGGRIRGRRRVVVGSLLAAALLCIVTRAALG